MQATCATRSSFTGAAVAARPATQARIAAVRPARRSVAVSAEYLGSATNQIMVLSTMLPLVAGRFGLAPTSTRHTNASGIKLLPEEKAAGLVSNDPAGFNAVDVLALGALGHVLGVGVVLGLKATGNL